MSTNEDMRIAFRASGLDYASVIIADGRLHRFKAAGDHQKNSWYVLHAGPPMAGAFGCWKRGFKETWCGQKRENVTSAAWRTIRKNLEQAEAERQRAETERHAQARKMAAWFLSRTQPVQSHPYLERKGIIQCDNLREHRATLVLPLHDASGELHSLQFINPDGGKKFLAGGKIAGCFFTLSDEPDGALVICEGYATGASIHEATGSAVVCAMNSGNLLAVSKALRDKFPVREIILAADNDQSIDGNPGLTKASEAAHAIHAKLIMPQFTDISSKLTDFNDLHQLLGLDNMKKQFDNSQPPKETDEQILKRLAALPPIEFDRCAKAQADELGISIGTLRSEVAKHRPQATGAEQGSAVDFQDVELWPEPVDGATVLNDVARTFSRYAVLPDGAADALALWVAHTHIFKSFLCSPRLNIFSPEKGCGKSTLRDVVAMFVPRPLLTENLTVAVLFRLVEAHTPTILADEYDAWLIENEELRGLLNAGHRRNGKVYRCEGDGHEVRGFSVFAPAVLCGIGALPGTLHDRSIVIRLERAKPGELLARFDSRRTAVEQELCQKLARWGMDNQMQLEAHEPTMPKKAFNRLADNWRPLFTIAGLSGDEWVQRAAFAFEKLTGQDDADAQGVGMMLLAEIQKMFAEKHHDRIFSKNLVENLCANTDRPWPEANRGKPITETWLGHRLRTFGISSKTIRIGSARAKGYEATDFTDAFERYLSA